MRMWSPTFVRMSHIPISRNALTRFGPSSADVKFKWCALWRRSDMFLIKI